MQSDRFGFSITANCKNYTRRSMLSTVSSVFDPLGFVAPYLLPAKKLLQRLCQENVLGWDDEVSTEMQVIWGKWIQDLPFLSQLHVDRCLFPEGSVLSPGSLHIFADASATGYGAVAYMHVEHGDGKISCHSLMGKSRVSPIKPVTIPRMELTAAVIALPLGRHLSIEYGMEASAISYYTDSTTVLHYIHSHRKRFPVYVANRVQVIREFSAPQQWKYISSSENPADEASRNNSQGVTS